MGVETALVAHPPKTLGLRGHLLCGQRLPTQGDPLELSSPPALPPPTGMQMVPLSWYTGLISVPQNPCPPGTLKRDLIWKFVLCRSDWLSGGSRWVRRVLGPVPGVLLRRGDTQGEGLVRTEAELRDARLPARAAKGCWQPAEAEGPGGLPLRASGKNPPGSSVTSGSGFRNGKQHVSMLRTPGLRDFVMATGVDVPFPETPQSACPGGREGRRQTPSLQLTKRTPSKASVSLTLNGNNDGPHGRAMHA